MVGRTAYRVVQEGLTNARKHAPAAAVRSPSGRRTSSLVVEVVSRAGRRSPPDPRRAGSGLIGLAERVELAGGALSTARTGAATSSCARCCRGRLIRVLLVDDDALVRVRAADDARAARRRSRSSARPTTAAACWRPSTSTGPTSC